MIGVAAGWGLFMVAAVSAFQWAAGFWKDQRAQLAQSQEQLRRMKGWLEVEPELQRRREELLGPFAGISDQDRVWASLQGLQKAASEAGVSVTELTPSENTRLDAKAEGSPDQLNQLLRKLPETLPGTRLDSLQLIPRDDGRVQGVLRLRLFKEGAG